MKTEKLYQPLMRRLPDAGHDNYYAVTDKQSRGLLTAIRLLLDKFEPIGDDYRHGLWIEVPRGKPSDWGTIKEAKDCYEEVKTKEDYLKCWQEVFPRETYWYYLSVGQYEGHTYLNISEHDMHWCCIHDDPDWNHHSIGPLEWYLGPLVNFLKEKVADIVKDPEAYNRYVEEHLPRRQRTGRIPRKDMDRIVPWQRRVPKQLEKGIQVLRECAANEAIYKKIKDGQDPGELPPFYRKPMDDMSIRIYSKYFRVAHEVFDSQHESWSERDREEREEMRKEDAQLDDIAYYRQHSLGHYGAITDETDFDSAKEFERIANDHYGELGFSRMDVHATDYYTPGKWLITFGFSYSAYIADAVDIAVALYETGCPLIIHDAQKILDVLEEKDNVLLTAYTFHDYFCHHDEGSVFSLPYECYLDQPDELTREQYNEIVSLAHWAPEEPVVLDTPIPLDNPAYDLIRDQVQAPLTACGILAALQKKYNELVFGIMTKGSRCYCYLIEHCEPKVKVEDHRLFPSVNGALLHAIIKYTELKKKVK